MTKHLTVRMAWHDNRWNGRICKDPESNIYCSGTHSLLSERIARRKNIEIEKKIKDKKIDVKDDYTPPCFWSCNAFSKNECDVKHVHPFEKVKVAPIPEKLYSFSIYTWPFRLAFNHSKKIKKIEGSYPPEKTLDKRINNFFDQLDENETILFFYLNYDNPISANETRQKYVLLGCSSLSKVGPKPHYNFSKEELTRIRKSSKKMKNFPTLRWSVELTHDFPNCGVLLPYNEYLERAKEFPEEEEKLKEMQVLIDKETVIPSFKYVASHIDEDKCLYLLYKIRKSILIVEEHGFVDVRREKKIIEDLIRRSWKRRGLFPALGNILDLILEIEPDDEPIGERIVQKLEEKYDSDPTLIDEIFDLILTKKAPIPEYLSEFSEEVLTLKEQISYHKNKIGLLKKLSLFNLTKHQIKRIIYQKDNPFKKTVNLEDIVKNPYLLVENYVPEKIDLDNPEIVDEPIELSKIDIGMLPHKKYVKKRNVKLQNLLQRSPERLRAIIIDYLKEIGKDGDCYASLDSIYDSIISYPIFYKEELNIHKPDLIDKNGVYNSHFIERLTIKPNEGKSFFYLNEVYQAEQRVKEIVKQLFAKPDHEVQTNWIDNHITNQIKSLSKKIPNFKKEQFREERKKLLTNIFRKSFFIISGKPGTGKTFVLKKIIQELKKLEENITLLAPTGKATLRLKQVTEFEEAKTIDRFLYKNGYGDYLEDFENLIIKKPEKRKLVNLIIDETSMVDLQKLAILFSILDAEGPYKIQRIILVGDEKQLPPIGLGKPFIDIIDYLNSKKEMEDHYIRLKTNCRQEFDETILKLADIFAENTRYYEEILDQISQGGQISPGLNIISWKNKEDLNKEIDRCLINKIKEEFPDNAKNKVKGLNLLFGLYDNGMVKLNSTETLGLDNLQILSPYRGGYFGTLGINDFVKSEYREKHYADNFIIKFIISPFDHADKIIRINNQYVWAGGKRILRLSNGSIGIINNKRILNYKTGKKNWGRRYYFLDQKDPMNWIDDEDNFELAYAITIHKSQGSDFNEVFTIVPRKPTLLSRELIYTALTRSKGKVSIFLQKTEETNPLEIARGKSFVLTRNTSIFSDPEDKKGIYEPEKGIYVKSKIEYIIYSALKSAGIDFEYERDLSLKGKSFTIHPDFTIEVNGKTYFWEHLGIVDMKDYYTDWKNRKQYYKENNYYENLITTDDLNGVSKEKISKLIQDILENNLTISEDEKFSKHHYQLYPD